jgi:hypothetical protein
MTVTINPLGISDEQIDRLEQTQGKWKKHLRRMHVEMYHMAAPDEADVKRLEDSVGVIPEDYKAFLQTYNGGMPAPNIVITKTNELVVNFFFPLKSPCDYPDNLWKIRTTCASRIPCEMLAIASGGSGDLVLLNLHSTAFGKIYYWNHDWESETDAETYFDNIELIADSFTQLLNAFRDLD